MHEIGLKIALIGVAGIAAQWIAWRTHLPAIVLLLVAGFVAGPATGFIDPQSDFGDLYRPLVSLAVAVILFEGGLTLNFKEIRETSTAVRRIIIIAGPLVWILSAVCAHFIGGLTWPTSATMGAILIVTGPTVITPLLRQARLAARPASMLKWEAIVNDPLGALMAVVTFEIILVAVDRNAGDALLFSVAAAFFLAIGGGYLAAAILRWIFVHGHVPEYLKAPVLLAAILLAFALSNLVLEEAGLLTVTVMGIVLANSRISSLTEMRRFKETISVFLVSGIFILLTASLTLDHIRVIDWRAVLFVAAVMVLVRPIAIAIATFGSGATPTERLLVGWIAPRGIVAVAVSGLFGATLAEAGITDADRLVPFTFAVVVATIVLHGFTLGPLARLLKLRSVKRPGILIVGGSRWSVNFARRLNDLEIPVMIADQNWNHIADARLAGIPVFYGDILSEEAHHSVDPQNYASLVAVTDNDAYNALVCTDFGPDLGRSNVFQLGRGEDEPKHQSLNFTLGGLPLTGERLTHQGLRERHEAGWTFQLTRLTDEFGYDAYRAARPEGSIILLWIKSSGFIVFASRATSKPSTDDRILSYALPTDRSKNGKKPNGRKAGAEQNAE